MNACLGDGNGLLLHGLVDGNLVVPKKQRVASELGSGKGEGMNICFRLGIKSHSRICAMGRDERGGGGVRQRRCRVPDHWDPFYQIQLGWSIVIIAIIQGHTGSCSHVIVIIMYLIIGIHFIEFINATNPIVRQHQRPGLHTELPGVCVSHYTSCEAGSTGGLATGVYRPE